MLLNTEFELLLLSLFRLSYYYFLFNLIFWLNKIKASFKSKPSQPKRNSWLPADLLNL